MAGPLYRDALARIHEAGFSGHIEAAAPRLLRVLASHGVESGRVVDLGCGPGHWLAALSKAGYEAWGIDASAEMIRLAQRRARKAGLIRAPLERAAIPRCAAVTALGEPLNYLQGPADVRALLSRVRAALPAGGLFLFDVRLPDAKLPRVSTVSRVEPGWAVFVEKRQDPAGTMVERNILSFTRERRDWKPEVETHRMRLYPAAALRAWLAAAGFGVQALRGYPPPIDRARAGFLAIAK